MLDVLGVVVEGLRCGVGEGDVFGVGVVVGGDDGVAGEVVIVRVAGVVYGVVIFVRVVIGIAGEADNAGVVKLDVAGLLVVVAIRLAAVVVAVIVDFDGGVVRLVLIEVVVAGYRLRIGGCVVLRRVDV